jgi:hypothetical protein
MSSMEELNAKVALLEDKIAANEALVNSGNLSKEREVSLDQRIASDTARLTALEQERRDRLQQQQQAGE